MKLYRYTDKNVRVYRTIPIYFPDNSKRKDINYSIRTKTDINLDALPTKEGIYLGVILYRPWDMRITSLNNTNEIKDFFTKLFPMFINYMKISDLNDFMKKNDSKLPIFSYVGPNLHKGL